MFRSLLAALLLTVLAVQTVAAEEASWHADPPKQGTDGFSLCIGSASAAGHTYTNTNYIDNEIAANCDRYAREDVARWYRTRGVEIDPASVRVELRAIR